MPDDPKLQYLKNLMLKYLCTDEGADAKDHMERAITTILQFTEAVRRRRWSKWEEVDYYEGCLLEEYHRVTRFADFSFSFVHGFS
jgi:hypothetical protein